MMNRTLTPYGRHGLGVVLFTTLLSGCGGGAIPAPPSTAQGTAIVTNRDVCAPVTSSVNFNATAIPRGSYLWFSSVMSVPGYNGNVHVKMWRSMITFRDGRTSYRIEGPNMELSLSGRQSVRIGFETLRDHWRLAAPYGTAGNDFLSGTAYRLSHALPGSIHNVTWSAQFQGDPAHKIQWKWAASVYDRFNASYARLGVKPLDDSHFPPYNSDSAGTPESYKAYAVDGATNGGYSPAVDVTPCRG